MREPEFLPEWYRHQLHRSRRGRVLARSAIALSLVTAVAIAVSPEQAPAVVSAGVSPAPKLPRTQRAATAPVNAPRIPSGARRALQALHDVTPAGVAVSAVDFRSDGGVTTVDLNCSADDAGAVEQFSAGLRGTQLFTEVKFTEEAAGAGEDPATFRLRLTVAPAEAR